MAFKPYCPLCRSWINDPCVSFLNTPAWLNRQAIKEAITNKWAFDFVRFPTIL